MRNYNQKQFNFNEHLSFGENGVFAFRCNIWKRVFISYNGYHYCEINPNSLTKTAKVTPQQYYTLNSEIFTAMSTIITKSTNNKNTQILKYYILNLTLRGLIAIEKHDFKTRIEYY